MTKPKHLITLCCLLALSFLPFTAQAKTQTQKPNIILILADDLGYRELGAYGQKIIKTPHLDQLAKDGIKFTNFYSGSTVCAPSRCVLLTGKHTGNSFIRGNYGLGDGRNGKPEGQYPIPSNTITFAKLLQKQGYTTGAIGKWGLGGPNSSGRPNKQGFDFFYGYLCQRVAHNYYPEYLWKNNTKEILNNKYFPAHQRLKKEPTDITEFEKYKGNDFAPDLMAKQAENFIRKNKDKPFFLYLPTPIPHVSLQVPDDSLNQYSGKLDKKPYLGNKGYLPHPQPRAAYAAMITRMDRDIGSIIKLLEDLKIDDNTIVIFTSDNGATFNGGVDRQFFASNGKLRGHKCNLYEGGIRVPMIVKWPGKIKPNTTSNHISALWDFFPTFADIAGYKTKSNIDGVSLLPTLLDTGKQKQHQYLYWEYHPGGMSQAVRHGKWKGIKLRVKKNPHAAIQLYDLTKDPFEQNNIADKNPKIVKKIQAFMDNRSQSEIPRWKLSKNK